ncbi:tetratricopeptide repeat protein [Asticcacaulis endophyticus]|nr:tetratricopeptide repeat protein [Asticcacaulis endophyticus]
MSNMDMGETLDGEHLPETDSAKVADKVMTASKSRHRQPLTGFIVLILTGLLMCAGAMFIADAPLGGPAEDWISWARIETVPSGVLLIGAVIILIGIIGCLFRLTAPVSRRPKITSSQSAIASDDFDLAIPEDQLQIHAEGLKTASVHYLSADTPEQTNRNRASLRFEAPPATTQAGLSQSQAPQTAPSSHELIPHYGDNAADAFGLPKPHLDATSLRRPADVPRPAATPATTDVLSPEHGLRISTPSSSDRSAETVAVAAPPMAEVIPLRPAEPQPAAAVYSEPLTEPEPAAAPMAMAETIADPIEAALLADTPETSVRELPESDINAVISSAMRFIETPAAPEILTEAPAQAPIAPAAHDAYAPAVAAPIMVEPHPLLAPVEAEIAPEPAPVIPALTPEQEIGQAVSTALSVWPDATRPIAAEELSVRLSYLYYDKSPKTRDVFDLIACGDLSAAASRLQTIANELMNAGAFAHSAELWRIYGALHMGRDDPKAMLAYEQVSELDPSDANVHLYLARRYQMDGRTDALAPVIGRALAVVSDPQTRSGLLTQYADIKFKVGDLTTAATAFEELSLINESLAYLDPGNIQVRSGQAMALARLAQIREIQGEHHKAAPMYRKAYEVFSELSAQMPGHAGLKAMADNALRDVQRLSVNPS